MEQYISKSALVAEIDNLIDKGKHHDYYQSAFRDGNNSALYTLKGRIDTLEVKKVDSTDAFIEKAVKYVANHFLAPGMDNEIKDFITYMKGE